MLPHGPYSEIDRTVAALGFLAEVRALEEDRDDDVDCTLTAQDDEELHRRGRSGDEDALAEWYRRQLGAPEPLEIPEPFRLPVVELALAAAA